MTQKTSNRLVTKIILFGLIAYLFSINILIPTSAQNTGLIFHYKESEGRTWAAWVMNDVNGDGKREIGIAGAIYTKSLDLSGNEIWDQWGLHHEVQWACDSGIDANGDGITEQLVFEAVWNNHYLLNGKTGVALESPDEENRRDGLYWPIIDCGFGLDVNVNGKGHNDYVITGVVPWNDAPPVVRCLESDNGSLIWEYKLSEVSNGIRPIKINDTQQILVISNNMTALSTQGAHIWSRTATAWSIAIIPNGSGANSDGIVINTGSGISLINASDNGVLWSAPHNIGTIHYCGDINNDGVGDFGGLWSTGLKTGLFDGSDGSIIRNHTAQSLLNYMHGIIYCGDLNQDGFDDYGIYGDFSIHEIFSGLDGSQLLAITGQDFHGAEEMYPVEDVNGNGSPDIMLFNGGIVVIDGWTLGTVDLPSVDDGIPGFNIGLAIIGVFGILGLVYLERRKKENFT